MYVKPIDKIPANPAREIVAKFDSTCPNCGGSIAAGEKVLWKKGFKAKHAVPCDEPVPVEPAQDFYSAQEWAEDEADEYSLNGEALEADPMHHDGQVSLHLIVNGVKGEFALEEAKKALEALGIQVEWGTSKEHHNGEAPHLYFP